MPTLDDLLREQPTDRLDERQYVNHARKKLASGLRTEDRAASYENPYGYSPAPGVVTRGGSSNVVAQPRANASNLNEYDSRLLQRGVDRQARRARVEKRRAADNTPEATQSRQAKSRYRLEDLYAAGALDNPEMESALKQVENPYGGGVIGSRQEKSAKWHEARAKRQEQKDLSRQRQFARAQMRSGEMFNEDGSADLLGSMAAQAFSRSPELGGRMAVAQEGMTLQKLIDAADREAAERRFGIDEMLASEQVAAGEFRRSDEGRDFLLSLQGKEGASKPPSIDTLVETRPDLLDLKETNPKRYTNLLKTVVDLSESNPERAEQMRLQYGMMPSDFAEHAESLEPNWMENAWDSLVGVSDKELREREAKQNRWRALAEEPPIRLVNPAKQRAQRYAAGNYITPGA